MMKDFKDIFNKSNCEVEPPENFKEVVLARIYAARAQKIQRKKTMFRLGFVFSGLAMLASGMFFGTEIATSEFWSIASLGFSDASIVLVHWQSFGLSLLETLPAVALSSLLVPVFVLLVLTKKYAEQQAQLFNKLSV